MIARGECPSKTETSRICWPMKHGQTKTTPAVLSSMTDSPPTVRLPAHSFGGLVSAFILTSKEYMWS